MCDRIGSSLCNVNKRDSLDRRGGKKRNQCRRCYKEAGLGNRLAEWTVLRPVIDWSFAWRRRFRNSGLDDAAEIRRNTVNMGLRDICLECEREYSKERNETRRQTLASDSQISCCGSHHKTRNRWSFLTLRYPRMVKPSHTLNRALALPGNTRPANCHSAFRNEDVDMLAASHAMALTGCRLNSRKC